MATNTKIEWTRGDDGSAGATWNPLLGCDRVSPGCDQCYAINSAAIRAKNPHPKVSAAFAGLTERRDGRLDWTGRINLLPERLTQPLTWKKPKRIFVNSLADLFHKDVPDEFIHAVFAVMAATPQHTYQLLTKRHGRMRSMLRDECRCPNAGHQPGVHFKSAIDWAATPHNPNHVPGLPSKLYHQIQWPLPNVWVGVSVEDQKYADLRIPALRDTPAAVRWLSCEPLLGPIDLSEHLVPAERYPALSGYAWDRGDLDWIVVGGESGPGSRPMHPQWARDLRDQSAEAGVAYLYKQSGQFSPVADQPRTGDLWQAIDGATAEWKHGDGHIRQGGGDFLWPGSRTTLMRRARSKHDAGRTLDGVTHDGYPSERAAVTA